MKAINMIKAILRIRGEKIIIVALIMILAAEIGQTVWPMAAIDSESADAIRNYITQKNSAKSLFIDSVGLYGFFLLTISLISTGIRRVRCKWTSIKGIALIIIGLVVICFHIVEIKTYMSIGKTLDSLKPPNMERIKLVLKQQNLPLNKRSKLSKMYARDKYMQEGKIVEYISETGVISRYEPTADDIKSINLQNNVREIWAYNNRLLPRLLYWWVAIGILGVILGVFTPVKNQHSRRDFFILKRGNNEIAR